MSWFRNQRAQFQLGLRITVAGLLSYFLCPLFGLSQTYPAVLTAVIVMQASVGASLKATMDRFVGSLGGALWAVAVLLALQHFSGFNTGTTLAVALAPLALLAAFKPAYRAAPAAAVILLLTPGSVGGPLAPAIQRMLGIGLGSVVALVVTLLVFRARAHRSFAQSAGRAATTMSELASILLKSLFKAAEPETIQKLHDEIRKAIREAETVADEVLRERATHLTAGADPLPMCRALRRLRNDFAMIGRATSEPFPESVRMELAEPSAETGRAISEFLEACGGAISNHQKAPAFDRCERELASFATTLTELRRTGLPRALPDEAVGRIFGLAFGAEQLHQNLEGLLDRINEMASARK